MTLLRENIIREGVSSIMGNRYVKSDDNKKILYNNAKTLYGHSMSQSLSCDEIKFDKNVCLEDILKISDDADIG